MVSTKRLSNFCGFQLQSQAGGQSVMSYLHFGHAQHVSSADLSAWSTRALCPTSLKGPTSAVEKMDSHCGKRKFKTYEDSDVFERYSELCARNVRARSPANLPQTANVSIFGPMYDVVVSSMFVHSNDQRKRTQPDSQRGLSAHEVESSKRIRRHTTTFGSASVDHIGTRFGHTQDSCLREIK